jgi:acetyltransferase-like isoleucine patch superfamily enzyme
VKLPLRLRNWLVHGPFGQLVRESTLYHYAIFGPPERVQIAPDAVVNDALFNVSSGTIRVGSCAFFGHGVSLLTGTHDIGVIGPGRKDAIPSEGHDIVIGEGAWISSNATVIGPCRIGSHAVVAAGAVVTSDVPPYTLVAGVPARVVRLLDTV